MAEEVVQHTPIRMKSNVSLFFKIALVAVIALLMLIPLAMVKSLVRERQNYADGIEAAISEAGKLPDVFICANDFVALESMQALRTLGYED